MRLFISVLLLGGAVFAPVTSFGQEAAGRVLAVAGNVTIERGAQRIPAQPGTEVRTGDTFQLGPQSNAQVRFTDDSLIALGSDTSFRVSEYAFQGTAPEAGRAFFNLIKGGMRTVTGLIGRSRRDNYGLQTATATIGIRGTAYAACQDCVSVSGEALPGTVVGFTEGAGFIRTQGGELPLATGESAHATNANVNPVRTLSFPRTQQEARARPTATQLAQVTQKEAAAATVSSVTMAAPSADSTVAGVLASTTTIATLTPLTPPVFQVTSTPQPVTLLSQSSFTGTSFYRLVGPFNIPTTCSSGSCFPAVAGEFTVAVNFALQLATASARFKLATGEIFSISIPSATGGVPITISGNQVTFNGTLRLVDFPNNTGAFSCSQCGPATPSNPGGTPGFVNDLTISGTISGSQATVTFAGTNTLAGGGGSGSITATLTQQAPLTNSAGAISLPRLAGGTDTNAAAFFDLQVDAAGRLTQLGPVVGREIAFVGGATNTIVGSAPTAGNLVWGTWTNGNSAATKATITDSNYNTFQPANGTVQVWITGDATNSLPPSLGTLTFTPVGSVFNSPSGRLNSASLTADFVNRSLNLSINATNTSVGNTFQLNGTTRFGPANNRFSAGFNSITCTGPCSGGTPGGGYDGFFAGSQAQGAGVAFNAGFGAGTGVTGAIGFRR
jgi:hypothetical protein